MLKFAADEDFDNRILRGLLRRHPDIEIIRIQDTHLAGAGDSAILEWVFQEKRILLTHDVSTMTRHAYDRLNAGQSIAGIVEVSQSLPIGQVSLIYRTLGSSLKPVLSIAEGSFQGVQWQRCTDLNSTFITRLSLGPIDRRRSFGMGH